MQTSSTGNTRSCRNARILLAALFLGGIIGGVAARPALADDDGWRHEHHRREEWREHEWREREWREHRQPYAYVAPGYVYAPPPVVYAPPPVVYAPPPGINFVFPLRFQ